MQVPLKGLISLARNLSWKKDDYGDFEFRATVIAKGQLYRYHLTFADFIPAPSEVISIDYQNSVINCGSLDVVRLGDTREHLLIEPLYVDSKMRNPHQQREKKRHFSKT